MITEILSHSLVKFNRKNKFIIIKVIYYLFMFINYFIINDSENYPGKYFSADKIVFILNYKAKTRQANTLYHLLSTTTLLKSMVKNTH